MASNQMEPVSIREGSLGIDRWLQGLLHPFISSPHSNKANAWEVVSIVRESLSDKSNLFTTIQDQAINKDWKFHLKDRPIKGTGVILNVLFADDNTQSRLIFLVDFNYGDESSDMYTKFSNFFENLNISEQLKTVDRGGEGSYTEKIVPIIVDAISNFGQNTYPGSNLQCLDTSLPGGKVSLIDSNQDMSVDRSRFLVSYFTPVTSSTTTMSQTCTSIFNTLLPAQSQGQGQVQNIQSSYRSTFEDNIPDCSFENLDIGRVVAAAVKKYNNFMTCSIKLNIFTELEINKFHNKAHKILTSPKVMSQFYPQQADSYQKEITEIFNDFKTSYIMKNQKRIRERFQARKSIMEDVKVMYKELFIRNCSESLAPEFIWKVYEKKAREHSLSTVGWDKPLETQLCQFNNSLSKTYNNTAAETEASQQVITEINKLEKCFKYESSATLLFHLTHSCLYGAVNMGNKNQSPETLGQWSPFIVFEGDKIIVGPKARALKKHFNLMSFLETGTKQKNSGSISGQIKNLEVKEMWAMFFIQIKNNIESKKNAYFNSCVLALSPSFSTTSKHILKTSLTLAGFTQSLLISSTTAIIIPTALEIGSECTDILVLYDGSQRLDISLARVGNNTVEVKAVGSVVQTQSTHKIRETISNVLQQAHSPIINLRTILCSDKENQYLTKALSWPIAGITFSISQNNPLEYVLKGAHSYHHIQLASSKFRITEVLPKLCKQHWKYIWYRLKWERLSYSWCYSMNEEIHTNKAVFIAVESAVGDIEDDVIKIKGIKLARSASIQITISSEGLLELQLHNINPYEKSKENNITIETKFLDSEQVEISKRKLSHYLQRCEYPLEENWNLFLERTMPTRSTQGSDGNNMPVNNEKCEGGKIEGEALLDTSTNTDISIEENTDIEDSGPGLTQAVAELKAYYEKVADVIAEGRHGISNQRILNKIKEELLLCEPLISQPIELSALSYLKMKFTTLKISTKALNID